MVNRENVRIRARKGKRICKNVYRYWGEYQWTARNVGMIGTTPTMCSCFMCGNPRKYAKGAERLTMQERRDKESIKDV